MVTAIPPLSDAEKLEFSANNKTGIDRTHQSKLVIASYNIRYARGPYLISGGLLRKVGLLNTSNRSAVVGSYLKSAAEAFSAGHLLPRPDVLALQEADKRTARTGRASCCRRIG
jgi:hypothetical protein